MKNEAAHLAQPHNSKPFHRDEFDTLRLAVAAFHSLAYSRRNRTAYKRPLVVHARRETRNSTEGRAKNRYRQLDFRSSSLHPPSVAHSHSL